MSTSDKGSTENNGTFRLILCTLESRISEIASLSNLETISLLNKLCINKCIKIFPPMIKPKHFTANELKRRREHQSPSGQKKIINWRDVTTATKANGHASWRLHASTDEWYTNRKVVVADSDIKKICTALYCFCNLCAVPSRFSARIKLSYRHTTATNLLQKIGRVRNAWCE